MTQIGAGWYKVSDNGTEYISIAIDKEVKSMLNLTDEHTLTLFTIKDEDRKTENSPNYRLVLSVKGKEN